MHVKKKTTQKPKSEKKDNLSFFKSTMKILGVVILFILKIPYYLISLIYNLVTKVSTKTKETKEYHKRNSVLAKYEDLKVIETITGDFLSLEEKISKSDSMIGIILGARGTGKSAFGIKFLENLYAKTKKKCFAIGFHAEDMPGFIEIVPAPDNLSNNSFVLIDEGGVLFNSRDSMSNANKLLSDLILVARHKNLSILFISQNSSNLDVNILRQADYLVLKPSSLLQIDFERKKIKEIYEEVKDNFDRYKEDKGLTYIYSDKFRGFVSNPLPSFWNVNISKSFK